jgi:trk system potassium uptake protein
MVPIELTLGKAQPRGPQVRVVVMGCGRVGSSLSDGLSRLGHNVAVIDRDSTAFNRLSPEFGGERVLGQGFDRDVLLRAGVEGADAFAAVSSGDNSNIISARLARETFGVKHVVARIYDAKRAEVYERLGIPTIATVPWTTDRLLNLITRDGETRPAPSRSLRSNCTRTGSGALPRTWKRPPVPGWRS